MTLDQKLTSLAMSPDGELEALLDTLSNAQFRVSGDILCSKVMPALDLPSRWRLIIRLTRYNRRAFLGTILKALCGDAKVFVTASPGQPSVEHFLREWGADMTDTDRHKTLLALLPLATTPSDVSSLLEIFGRGCVDVGHGHDIDYLIASGTPASYFVLLGYMRIREHDKPLLTAVCRRVMRRADGVSFNAASLFKAFFDLPDVRGTFSLRIEPYELGRLEHDYQTFLKALSF